MRRERQRQRRAIARRSTADPTAHVAGATRDIDRDSARLLVDGGQRPQARRAARSTSVAAEQSASQLIAADMAGQTPAAASRRQPTAPVGHRFGPVYNPHAATFVPASHQRGGGGGPAPHAGSQGQLRRAGTFEPPVRTASPAFGTVTRASTFPAAFPTPTKPLNARDTAFDPSKHWQYERQLAIAGQLGPVDQGNLQPAQQSKATEDRRSPSPHSRELVPTWLLDEPSSEGAPSPFQESKAMSAPTTPTAQSAVASAASTARRPKLKTTITRPPPPTLGTPAAPWKTFRQSDSK